MITAAALSYPASAAADEVVGTRSEQLVEADHRIDVTVGYAGAELRVRRTLHNGGPRHDQAEIWIDVPWSAVATGLRTLGERGGRPHWFAGDLLEAEMAAARYQELTGFGVNEPKDPALLSWLDQSQLALQVFPVAPGSNKTVEYTLTMPVIYEDGEYWLQLPEIGTEDLAAAVSVRPQQRLDQILVDGKPVGRGATFRADEERVITLRRRDPPRFDARLAVVGTGKQYIVQYQLALGRRISRIPDNASIVVVLDRSRSLQSWEHEESVAAARAYLRHFKGRGARVEVVTFDRKAKRRYGGMRSVEAVLADLHHIDRDALGNGSAIDLALGRAGAILAREPKGRPRRVVVLTDARTRKGMATKRLEMLARRTGAIVHIGELDGGQGPEVVRDDEHKWATVCRATGGLAWRFTASVDPDPAEEMRDAYLEWARPVRLDHAEVRSDGTFAADLELEDSLLEGFGTQRLAVNLVPVDSVVLTGELWSQEVREVTLPNKAHGTLWAALFFGSDELEDVDEDEMMVLARRGQAVSPVTSYLAIEPGVRPSTEGLDHLVGTGMGGGGIGEGTIGLGNVGLIGKGGGLSMTPMEFLELKTRAAATACGIADETAVELELETTRAEIVHIERVSIASDAVGRQCVEEGLWEVALPDMFKREHADWKVVV